MSTTQVAEKDLPPAPEAKFINAPETLEDAIKRLMEAEMRLEDLSRATEIAMITRQFDMVESFKASADEYLLTKVLFDQPTAEDFKITIVTDKEEDAKTQ
jgi:hypothetical protein